MRETKAILRKKLSRLRQKEGVINNSPQPAGHTGFVKNVQKWQKVNNQIRSTEKKLGIATSRKKVKLYVG